MITDLKGLDAFVAAVETGSFAAAAERLHLTRSAVAKAVAKIETALNVRLLNRTTRSQSLTEDGQIYYDRCVRALNELRAGEDALASGMRHAAGRLRVLMPVLFGRRCVAPVLARLAMEHPKLELDLSFSDRPADLMDHGFDLAIRNGDISDGAGLMTRTIGFQRMTVCASPIYLAEHGQPQTLDDLPAHQAITYARDARCRKWQFPILSGGLLEMTPPSRLRFDDLESIADAAEAGHGLAWVPSWLIRDRVQTGVLIPLLGDGPQLVIETHVLWPITPHLPLRVRLAIDALAAGLPGCAEL